MKKIFDLKEVGYIGILFLLALLIFKIAFFKEDLSILFSILLSLFWLFIIPGYFLMLYWKEALGFTERFIVGIILSAALIGIISYPLGLIGIHIKYHQLILPAILILVGILARQKKQSQSKQ